MGDILFFTTTCNGCDALKSEMYEYVGNILPTSLHYTNSIDQADIVCVFCCSFTSERECNTIKTIQELQNREKKVIVSGCYLPQLKKHFSDVEFVRSKDLKNFLEANFGLTEMRSPKKAVCYDANNTLIIPIASGCIGHCTFCSIRQVRGKLISRPVNDVLETISQIENCKKVKLVGQDVSAYGNDIGSSLPDLLRNIWERYPNLNIELGNLNISVLKHYSKSDLELFQYISGNINLPVQSGSNNILKMMSRDYFIEDFYRLYEVLSVLQCKISTDIIAGFPTETEKDHLINMDLMKNYFFSFAQIFMYDPRPNTLAASMKQTNRFTKQRRTIELIAQFLSTLHKRHHYPYNKMQEIQFFNTNITIK